MTHKPDRLALMIEFLGALGEDELSYEDIIFYTVKLEAQNWDISQQLGSERNGIRKEYNLKTFLSTIEDDEFRNQLGSKDNFTLIDSRFSLEEDVKPETVSFDDTLKNLKSSSLA